MSNNPTPATMAAVRSDTWVKGDAFSFVFISFSFFIQLNLRLPHIVGILFVQALNCFWSLDGLAQHRNANAGAYDSPDNREDSANNRYPADIGLEKDNGGNVSFECNRQRHKKYISNRSVPNKRQSDITRGLYPGWELRTLLPETNAAERS